MSVVVMLQELLKLISLTAFGILCASQSVGLHFLLRTSSDRETGSVRRSEHSSSYQDSARFFSLPHSRPDHHDNKERQRHHLNSKLSRKGVVEWDEAGNYAVAESGRLLEKQVEKDEQRRHVELTPQLATTSRRSRMRRRQAGEELIHGGTSSYSLQRQRQSTVDDISKKPRRSTRQRRSSIKDKPSNTLHDHHIRIRSNRKSQSFAPRFKGERSKTRSRKRGTRAHDNSYENFKSTKRLNRRQLSGPQSTEEEDEDNDDTDVSYDDVIADEDELKEERDVEEEETVQKRQSDEVMISKAVLKEMDQRILTRVKDFIDKNRGKNQTATLASAGNVTTETTSASEQQQQQ